MDQSIQDVLRKAIKTLPHEGVVGRPSESKFFKEFTAILDQEGFDLLGSGYYSAAFSFPNDPEKVLKIGFKPNDDKALEYLKICQKNQGLKGLPQIYYLGNIGPLYVAILKKYVSYHKAKSKVENLNSRNNISQGNYIRKDYGRLDYVIRQNLEDLCSDKDNDFYLKNACRLIRDHFERGSLDLHEGNIMMDPDTSEIVITDPVA